MSFISNQVRTKRGAIIGVGIVLAVTAFTVWSWSGHSAKEQDTDDSDKDKKERDVKTIETEDLLEAFAQSRKLAQAKQKAIEEVLESSEIRKKKAAEVHAVVPDLAEAHCDESSSIKSSADEADIYTPEHEASNTPDVKNTESYKSDTRNVKFDWSDDSVSAALPPTNLDAVVDATDCEHDSTESEVNASDVNASAIGPEVDSAPAAPENDASHAECEVDTVASDIPAAVSDAVTASVVDAAASVVDAVASDIPTAAVTTEEQVTEIAEQVATVVSEAVEAAIEEAVEEAHDEEITMDAAVKVRATIEADVVEPELIEKTVEEAAEEATQEPEALKELVEEAIQEAVEEAKQEIGASAEVHTTAEAADSKANEEPIHEDNTSETEALETEGANTTELAEKAVQENVADEIIVSVTAKVNDAITIEAAEPEAGVEEPTQEANDSPVPGLGSEYIEVNATEEVTTEAVASLPVESTAEEQKEDIDEFVQINCPEDNSSSSSLSEKNEHTSALSSSLTVDAPVFVPMEFKQPKKHGHKRFLTRDQLIDQQRQNYTPKSKARCTHWPHCTNNNCKFSHPYQECRFGDKCSFGKRCMFIHADDCV